MLFIFKYVAAIAASFVYYNMFVLYSTIHSSNTIHRMQIYYVKERIKGENTHTHNIEYMRKDLNNSYALF